MQPVRRYLCLRNMLMQSISLVHACAALVIDGIHSLAVTATPHFFGLLTPMSTQRSIRTVILNGSLARPSKTRSLLDALHAQLHTQLPLETLHIDLVDLFEDIGTGNLYVNLDPANLILYGKANPVDALDVLGGYVRGVHAKDGLYPTNGRELGHEVKVGDGKVNFPKLLARLHELGYDGSLTIEREISGPQQIADIQATKKYLEELIAAL